MTGQPLHRPTLLAPRACGLCRPERASFAARTTAPHRIARVCAAFLLLLATSAAARAQDGSFQSRGLQLHYRSIGSGAPVILLSGGPGLSVDYMRPVADAFPDTRRILLEQRGTGRSVPADSRPQDMTLSVAIGDLEALRQHLGQERLFLVGHSWGGMLAMAYAAEHPARVDRLILIGSGGPTLDFATRFEDNIRARLRPEDSVAERYWIEAQAHGVDADKVALEIMRALTPAYLYDRAKGLAFADAISDGSINAASSELLVADLAKNYDVREGLRRLDRPVLIVHGHQDPMGEKTAEDIHALIRSATIRYLHKCGHFPWIEQPAEFGNVIAEFIAAWRGTAR